MSPGVSSYHQGVIPCYIYQTYSPPMSHGDVDMGIGMVVVEIEVTSLKTVTRLRRRTKRRKTEDNPVNFGRKCV